jgi:hypothetical protein
VYDDETVIFQSHPLFEHSANINPYIFESLDIQNFRSRSLVKL